MCKDRSDDVVWSIVGSHMHKHRRGKANIYDWCECRSKDRPVCLLPPFVQDAGGVDCAIDSSRLATLFFYVTRLNG